MPRLAVGATLCALLLALALASTATAAPETRPVLVVANNWDGTADVVDPHTFERLTRLNIVPDRDRRIAEILLDPVGGALFLGNSLLVGEGHHQYVDDAFTSLDGRFLYVSRPSLADVVAFDLRTREIVWRFPVDGNRADHMAISPDGRRLLVSASTARKVHVIDTQTGRAAGEFASGDSPHENNYSADGKRIFHASIGLVYTPADLPALDTTKGDRWLQVVDAETLEIRKRVDVGQILAAAGHPGLSSAVRPMALSPDERIAYLQLSFLHGFVEYDLERDEVLRIARLPITEAGRVPRETYLLDSAHHGIAMDPKGTQLCVAGTMSDYAALVPRETLEAAIVARGRKPYWSTNSADGRYCFVSFSGDDRVSVISYAERKEVASIRVGDHPQRMRMGVMRSEYLPPAADGEAPRLSRVQVVRRRGSRGRGRALRLSLSEPARVSVDIRRARTGRRVGSRCVAAARPPRVGLRCQRWPRVRVVERSAGAGVARVSLKRLRSPGRYRLHVSATDAARNTSPQRIVRFRLR